MASRIQRKTPRQHVLDRSGMYIGSITRNESGQWLYDGKHVTWKEGCSFVPGLMKIIDEGLVNAADAASQPKYKVSEIQVFVDAKTGVIRICNNGIGLHPDDVVAAFGELLSSTNYDDEEERLVGGTNGIGIKACNIFCSRFEVVTAFKNKKVTVVWYDNMSRHDEPVVERVSAAEAKQIGVQIEFLPDYARFGMKKGLKGEKDLMGVIRKRVLDMAALTPKKVKVSYNGKLVPVRNFKELIPMFVGDAPHVYAEINDRWEIFIALSEEESQVSYVNCIATTLGGPHVDHVRNQVVKQIVGVANKKKGGSVIKNKFVKGFLNIGVNCKVVNPSFSSQTKERLTTKKFGSTCPVPERLVQKFVKTSKILDLVHRFAEFKEKSGLTKTDGKKTRKIKGIPMLEDANKAGTVKSKDCTLMLVEGLSAKTLAMSGMTVVGRNLWGVYPLKGKLLNARDASTAQISKNKELTELKKILGLTEKTVDLSALRYGKIMIMTDQDVDGSHIKGLILNWLQWGWPDLLLTPDFVQYMRTPIVKATKGSQVKAFYSLPQYEKWKGRKDRGKWKVKYYKGLGTSTASEAKDYFRNLEQNRVYFDVDDDVNESITLAFQKDRADDRKSWLRAYNTGKEVEGHDATRQTVTKFIQEELVLFSLEDLHRSIPDAIDGLKPSQRKVLYGCFKRNLKDEIKVAQLAGYVSEHSAYHHGEASLHGTITGMGQNYPCSGNNLNLLEPCGQFGSRLEGGKDAASPRYIFTKLELVTRALFPAEDFPVLKYLDDDGMPIEPERYVPVLPLGVVNGMEGIGTGFSTSLPPHNPLDVVENLRRHMQKKRMKPMTPWYRGFTGKTEIDHEKQLVTYYGRYLRTGPKTLVIDELPPTGSVRATNKYKEFLATLTMENTKDVKKPVKEVANHSTDMMVKFELTFPTKKKLDEVLADEDTFLKTFKLAKSVRLSNIHAFNRDGVITKFKSVLDLIKEFVPVRVKTYALRKEHLLGVLSADLVEVDARIHFLTEIIKKTLKVMRRPEAEIVAELAAKQYPKVKGSYEYLLSMSIRSFTKEKIEKLKSKKAQLEADIADLSGKTEFDLWEEDLQAFERAYEAMLARDAALMNEGQGKASRKKR